jgi:tetratricopeptide (TPR) repeat protein
MKLYKKLSIAVALIATSLTSCDLDTQSTTSLNADNVLNKVEDGEKIIAGTWSYLLETFNSYRCPGYASFLLAGDAMGSDVAGGNDKYGPTRDNYDFGSAGVYAKGYFNAFSWTLSYATIDNMNSIIASIDEAAGAQADRDRIKGQALALRGFIYLHLATYYSFAINKDPNAVCVPIYLKPSDVNTEGQPAASVSEVYARAITDLEEALTLIPENYARSAKWKIDTQVTLGLLSRATLYAREWDKAKTYSDRLLAKNDYLMGEAEYKSGFNSVDNKEWIWGQPQTPDQSNASYTFYYWDTTYPGYFSYNLDPHFLDNFNDGDYRKSLIYWDVDPGVDRGTENGNVWLRYTKFKIREDETGDIVLLRTSEIYLINAEAKAHLNDPGAVTSLNALKAARGATTVATTLSGQDLLDAIWLERRKELWGEGFALADIIRNQQAVVRKPWDDTTPVDFPYTDAEGVVRTVKKYQKGHSSFKFPDGTDFAPNSKYYLYRIIDTEETENPNLYSKHPKLGIY